MNTNAARDARLAALLRKAADELDPKGPKVAVKVQPKAAAKPAKKAKKAPKVSLTRQTRLAFIAAAKKAGTNFEGLSTQTIAGLCIENPALTPKGFVIGEGYKALLAA